MEQDYQHIVTVADGCLDQSCSADFALLHRLTESVKETAFQQPSKKWFLREWTTYI